MYAWVFDNKKLCLTLPMLRLLTPKGKGCKDFRKPPKPCFMRTDAPNVLAGARLVRPYHTSEI